MSSKNTINRRTFLKSATVAAAAPMIVPSSVLGLGSSVAPSERVTVGCIGVGGRGSSNMRSFLKLEGSQVVAVCDVDVNHRNRAKRETGLDDGNLYNNFEDVIARDDIDAVSIGTPDHWHAYMTIASAHAGKDIYCEKPLSLTLDEGRSMVNEVNKAGRILQTGTHRRSINTVRKACELVRNGRVGDVHTVHVGVPEGFLVRGDYSTNDPVQPVPEGFDYDRWLGQAPDAPYTGARCHFNFRWIKAYSAGYITDWGAHYYDLAQWGLGMDHTGPVKIEGEASFPEKGLYDASILHRLEFTYANGVKLISTTTKDSAQWGARFEGSEGSLYIETKEIITDPKTIDTSDIGPDGIHLYRASNHHVNFLDCVKSRKQPSAPGEVGHRSASICHIGAIALELNEGLTWDPVKEEFEGNTAANALCSRPSRGKWGLESLTS